MGWKNAFWWLCFTVLAVWGQYFFHGVDLLVAGLILSLQEEDAKQTLWLLAAWMLIQEGAGSLAFGHAILWYGAVLALFFLGRWLFEAENVLFILLLGLALGAWRYLLVQLMANLNDYAILDARLLRESLLQGLVIPPSWYLARRMRQRTRSAARLV